MILCGVVAVQLIWGLRFVARLVVLLLGLRRLFVVDLVWLLYDCF